MDLTQIFGNNATVNAVNYSATQVAFNIFFSFVLSILISFVYQITHKGYSYSKGFVTSLVLISIIVSVVMMVIGNSLARAFALLGSFSIIRFRTAIKDTRDTAFVFLALVIGMAIGTNNYVIGIIGTVLILIVVIILDRFNLVGADRSEYTASIFTKGQKQIDWKTLNTLIKTKKLLSVSSRENGKITEFMYSINLKKGIDADNLTKAAMALSGVERVNLFSTKEELEY